MLLAARLNGQKIIKNSAGVTKFSDTLKALSISDKTQWLTLVTWKTPLTRFYSKPI